MTSVFPLLKLERKSAPKKFVASNGEQIGDLGKKTIPFKTNEDIHRCIPFRSASVDKPFTSMQKVLRSGNNLVLEKKIPHFRKHSRRKSDQAGREQWSVHNRYVDSSRRDRSSFQLAGTESGQTAFDKPARATALCRSGETELSQFQEMEETIIEWSLARAASSFAELATTWTLERASFDCAASTN